MSQPMVIKFYVSYILRRRTHPRFSSPRVDLSPRTRPADETGRNERALVKRRWFCSETVGTMRVSRARVAGEVSVVNDRFASQFS